MMASAQPLDFVALMPAVASKLLGKPSSTSKTELRYGTNGSLSIDLNDGQFYSHEEKVGGGVLDLIIRERGGQMSDALRWLEESGLKDREIPQENKVWQLGQNRTRAIFYDYTDADGVVVFRVERREENGSKTFRQHGPDGRGGFRCAAGYMEGVKRVPYLLHSLAAAGLDQIVFVVEGEKDADRLASLGLIATTNSQGAGAFGADLAEHFAGRRVVVIGDNDDQGRKHAADVVEKMRHIAAAVVALDLPDLPHKGDVSNWLNAGGTADDLIARADAALASGDQSPETFELADLSLWARTLPTPKAFVMAPFIPRDDVVIITGDGGTNKSTLALQISACAAAGKQMLGMDVAPGPALYITAEDDNRENHWRLAKIASALGTTIDALAGRLHLASLRGRLNNELATFEDGGKLRPAAAYALLRATIEKTKATLVTLDNVAHLFAGNENDRGQVTAFINLLYQLCGDLGVTILLIAHRNKAGDSYSGSTAWLNAVRSQVLLERSDENDADVRKLSLGKANYARAGEEVEFRWHDFALIRNDDLPASVGAELAATIQANADNAIFLRCLAERNKHRRQVSEKPNASNYAPKIFEKMPEAKGMKKARLETAMDRLFRISAIERDIVYRDTGEGKDVYGLRETGQKIPEGLPEGSRKVFPEDAGNPQESTGNSVPISKDISGAATVAAAPDRDDEVDFPPEPVEKLRVRPDDASSPVIFPAASARTVIAPARFPIGDDEEEDPAADEFTPKPRTRF
jgi:RecA-family ATPase